MRRLKLDLALVALLFLVVSAVTAIFAVRAYATRQTDLSLAKQTNSLISQKDSRSPASSGRLSGKTASQQQTGQIVSLDTSENNVKTIVFNQYGFDPNIDNVALGSSVTVKNQSSSPVSIEAVDWTGAHISGSPLNLGTIAPNTQATFTLKTPGMTQYQANGNPAMRGEIEAHS